MQFDDQIRRYFGVDDLAAVEREAIEPGIERMRVDLGMAADPTQRFALWSLLYMLGAAPDLDIAFERDAEREAARTLMDLIDRHGTEAA